MTQLKPYVQLVAYDENDNELTITIECEVNTHAAVIELWQYLRMQTEKWVEKYGMDKQR